MFGMPGTIVGLAGIALAASFAHASFNKDLPGRAGDAGQYPTRQVVLSDAKGDRVAAPVAAEARTTVSAVELIGVGPTAVILRDVRGVVLYESDPRTNTTYFAKNADLPTLTVKQEETSPVAQQPVERREGKEEPSAKRKGNPVGCLSALSPLVKSDVASSTPGVCMVMLDDAKRQS